MVKKPMKKQPSLLPPSSSHDEIPSFSPVKKLSAGSTAAVLRKHPEPSLESAGGEKEEHDEPSEDSGNAAPKHLLRAARRVSRTTVDAINLKLKKPSAATKTLAKILSVDEKSKENDENSESEEKESTNEAGDSGNAAPQPNPLKQPQVSQTANDGKQVANTSLSSGSGSRDGEKDSKELNSRAETKKPLFPPPPQAAKNSANPIVDPSLKPSEPSKSADGEEEEDEGFESEEEQESTDVSESSEDFGNTATKENLPPHQRDSQNMDGDKKPSNTSSSSPGLGNDETDPISDSFLTPLINEPIDSSAQPVEKESNSGKQSAARPAQISKKRRTARVVRSKEDQEKERFRRIWNNEDELALLQGILEYKEQYHVIPYAHVHAESLLKSVKDSLSISASVNQINDKVRRMKKRYNNTATRQFFAKKSKISDPHNAAVFDLSKKIWDSLKEESIFIENKVTPEKKEEIVNEKTRDSKHFAGEYPSIYWFLRSEHANNALVLQNHIPIADAGKLEEKCKKLEMIDIQLNMQKIEFLSSAVKLIKDALAKC